MNEETAYLNSRLTVAKLRRNMATCRNCGQPVKWISERTSFSLKWIPLEMVPGKRAGTWKLFRDSFGGTEHHRCNMLQVRHFAEDGTIKTDYCGQRNGDGNREYNGAVMSFSSDWSKVTCKNCLSKRAREQK